MCVRGTLCVCVRGSISPTRLQHGLINSYIMERLCTALDRILKDRQNLRSSLGIY